MAKCQIIREKEINPLPITKVILELTPEEAVVLKILTGRISFLGIGEITEKIYRSLPEYIYNSHNFIKEVIDIEGNFEQLTEISKKV